MKKWMSLAMILIGIASIPLLGGDATVGIFFMMLGIGYLFCKEEDRANE